MTSTAVAPIAPILEDSDVLAAVRGFSDRVEDAELGIITAALEWAHRNPGEVLAAHSEHWWHASMAERLEWERLAYEVMPLVDDMSIPEFAYAARVSHRAARTLIRDALVLFYCFPRAWSRLANGHVPTWRARLVAQKGRGLPAAAARFVDANLPRHGTQVTGPKVQRLVDEARLRYTPEEVEAELAEEAEQRRVEVDTSAGAHVGLADLTACLDLPDALDLEAALAHGASRLKELGSTDSLNVRRSHALGDLARSAQNKPTLFDGTEHGAWDGAGVPTTGVKLYIHLNHTALKCACAHPAALNTTPPQGASVLERFVPSVNSPASRLLTGGSGYPTRCEEDRGEAARVEGTGMPAALLPPEVIRSWFTRPTLHPDQRPRLVIRRVLDPEEYVHTEAYEVPDRTREAVQLRESSCVFPFCHSPTRNCDTDHVTPFADGGPTCPCNLAPLCRFHHRVKTHGQHHDDHKWTYASLGQGTYAWRGPNGIHLLRTPGGTRVLVDDVFATRPEDHHPTPGTRKTDGTHTAATEGHPAYATVTDPDFLPRATKTGAPLPHDDFKLLDKVIRQRAITPAQKGEYVPYAARGGDDVRRPTLQIIKDAGTLSHMEADGRAAYTNVMISNEPPPF